MKSTFLSAFGSIATVALIVIATRWLIGAKGAELPRIRDGNNIYTIKWQWRTVGLLGGVFWLVVLVWSWRDLHSRPDFGLFTLTLAFVTAGLWLGSGKVTTNETGISRTGLWRSRYFRWKEVTEFRLHKRQGGAIELRSGSQKLIIDSRFAAFQHLLSEIEDRTQLHPIEAS